MTHSFDTAIGQGQKNLSLILTDFSTIENKFSAPLEKVKPF